MKTVTKTWLVALAAAILLSTPSAPAQAGDLKDATAIVNRTNAAQRASSRSRHERLHYRKEPP